MSSTDDVPHPVACWRCCSPPWTVLATAVSPLALDLPVKQCELPKGTFGITWNALSGQIHRRARKRRCALVSVDLPVLRFICKIGLYRRTPRGPGVGLLVVMPIYRYIVSYRKTPIMAVYQMDIGISIFRCGLQQFVGFYQEGQNSFAKNLQRPGIEPGTHNSILGLPAAYALTASTTSAVRL